MNQISLDWDTVKKSYPMRPLKGGLAAYMAPLVAENPHNTPCCLQMSHALLAAGVTIPAMSNRRSTPSITTELGRNHYLMAVDEMNWFLTDNWGVGDILSAAPAGSSRPSISSMKATLDGRTGILVFSDLHLGMHTELWDVDRMHQRDIVDAVFNAAQVLFWDVMITAMA